MGRPKNYRNLGSTILMTWDREQAHDVVVLRTPLARRYRAYPDLTMPEDYRLVMVLHSGDSSIVAAEMWMPEDPDVRTVTSTRLLVEGRVFAPERDAFHLRSKQNALGMLTYLPWEAESVGYVSAGGTVADVPFLRGGRGAAPSEVWKTPAGALRLHGRDLRKEEVVGHVLSLDPLRLLVEDRAAETWGIYGNPSP